jgi:hypothetical protein
LPPCAAISCISLFFLQRRETRRVRLSAQNRHADLAFIAALRGNLLYFPVFSAKTRNTPRAAAQQKNPARHAVRVPGVVSVNTFFWKILVTRVKRGIELPLSP